MIMGLLFTAAFIGSGICCAISNADSKKNTYHRDSNGNAHWMDRKGTEYVNGEKLYPHAYTDQYGNWHSCMHGVQSGKTYYDSVDATVARMKPWDEERIAQAKAEGKNCCLVYNPIFEKSVSTEISTGKVITCLYKGTNDKTGVKSYRKFYFNPNTQKKWDYDRTEKGDYGIEITQAEYERLNSWPSTYSTLPKDGQVLNELWGVDCFH